MEIVDKKIDLSDNWEISETIQAKILYFDAYEVYVDCLIDSENNVVQSRKFPITLFKSLPQIKEGKPVLIKNRLKPGAIRIDVYPGEGIVKMEVFEINENLESLRGANLDCRLKKWLPLHL